MVGNIVRFAFICGSTLVVASAAAVVSVQPPSPSVGLGSSLGLNVAISGVTDLFSFQFDVGFTPSVLQANSITEGSFLPVGGATIFVPGTIDNTAGVVSSTADTLSGFVPGVTGSGTLATLQFKALAVGMSPITLSNIILLDSNLNDIPFTVNNGTVSVQGGAPGMPEPATYLLVSTAVMILCLGKRLGFRKG